MDVVESLSNSNDITAKNEQDDITPLVAHDTEQTSTSQEPITDSLTEPLLYTPTEELASRLQFVLEAPLLRNSFELHVAKVCRLSGSAEQLEVVPYENQLCDSEFSRKAFGIIDEFISSISTISVNIDAELEMFFSKNNPEIWFKNVRDECNLSTNFILSIKMEDTRLKIRGKKNDVIKCEEILAEQFKEEVITKTDETFSRRNLQFGWLEDMEEELEKRVSSSHLSEEGTYTLQGKRCFLTQAIKFIQTIHHNVVTKVPNLSEEKLLCLKKLFLHENRCLYEDFIHNKFQEQKIKCMLWMSNDPEHYAVFLLSKTYEMHDKGSKFLDEILQVTEVPLPKLVSEEVFQMERWTNTFTQIEQKFPLMVQIWGKCIYLFGLVDSVLPQLEDLINHFFMGLQNIKKIECSENVKQFAKKFIIASSSMKTTDVLDGFLLEFPSEDTIIACGMEKKIKDSEVWSVSTEMSFRATKLHEYFLSNKWKNYKNALEDDLRCSIVCTLIKQEQENNLQRLDNTAGSFINGAITIVASWSEVMTHAQEALNLAKLNSDYHLKEELVAIKILSDDRVFLDQAKRATSRHMNDLLETRTICDEILTKLDHNDRFDIYQAAVTCGATVTFDDCASRIVLKGKQTNVRNLFMEINMLLLDVKKAFLRSKQLVWKGGNSSQCLSSFSIRISHLIEEKYENQQDDSCKQCLIPLFGNNMHIFFPSMTFKYNNAIGKLERNQSIENVVGLSSNHLEANC